MSGKDNEHPSIRTNAALVALSAAVAAGKGVTVPLWREQGHIIAHPKGEGIRYTKKQAADLLADCMAQARTASLAYASDLPTNPKAALAVTYTLKGGDHIGKQVGAWAHALNASVGFRTEAGKAIRAARQQATIAETGGYVCEGVDGVFHSRKEARKQGLRATYGADWWKLDNANELRKEWSKKVTKAGEAPASPAPAPEAQTATVTKAVLVDRCKQLSLNATGTKAELQARIDAVPLAGQLGWHS